MNASFLLEAIRRNPPRLSDSDRGRLDRLVAARSAVLSRRLKVHEAMLIQLGQHLVKAGLKLQRAFDGEGQHPGAKQRRLALGIDQLGGDADADDAAVKVQADRAVAENDDWVRVCWFLRHDGSLGRVRLGGQS